MKNVLITGASGMIGDLILEYCLDSQEISKITSLVRKKRSEQHDKLNELVITDFLDYSNHENAFENIDVVYFCIGVYTGAVPDEQFKEITVDFTIAFTKMLKKHSPKANLIFLSGAGADRKEKSRISFAKYKGMAENYLFANLDNISTFRPGYIYPVSKRYEPNFSYRLYRTLYPLIKLMGPSASIKSTDLAKAMFRAGISGSGHNTVENRDAFSYLK